jgi:uncharacterized damage-inducible protein DinB
MVHASTLSDHLRYSEWASRRLMEFAATVPAEHLTREIGNSHGGILKTFQHIYYADRVWLGLMEGNPPPAFADPDPGPSMEDLNTLWWPLLDRFSTWAAEQQDPERVMHYKNLKGDPYSKSVYHIVLHVVNHGTYHRGQIASMLRQLGHVPPYTDFIYYVDGLRG